MKLYLLLFAALAAAQVSGGDYDCDATKAKCTSDCQAKGRTVVSRYRQTLESFSGLLKIFAFVLVVSQYL